MTRDERLAKVAEVLAGHRLHATMNICTGCDWRATPGAGSLGDQHDAHRAAALAPLLDEFRAEDEARPLREAADTLWRIFLRLPHTPSPLGDYVQRKSQEFRRAALGAAEPDAREQERRR